MYEAEGNCIYYVDDDGRHLFLTVHETPAGTNAEKQAVELTKILNNL